MHLKITLLNKLHSLYNYYALFISGFYDTHIHIELYDYSKYNLSNLTGTVL